MLGQACARALHDAPDLALVGVVRRSPGALPHPFAHLPTAGHLRELQRASVALLCVPAQAVLEVARDVLQQRVPLVECAALEGAALPAHHRALGKAARQHRVAAVVHAGWQPGALPLLRRVFETLIARGHTESNAHPGVSLHQTAALEDIAGVRAALEAGGSGIVLERRGAGNAGAHHSLLLEARFDVATLAARVMLDGARQLPRLEPGWHIWSPRA